MTSQIEIPENFVQEFINENDVNGSENEPEFIPDEQTKAGMDVFMDIAEKTFLFAFERFDEVAKEKDLPGLGAVPAEDVSTLSFIVVKKHVPEQWLANTPEFALASVLSGILINNLIQLRKNRSKTDGQKNNE